MNTKSISEAASTLGKIKTEKKAASSRENGKRGGRPQKDITETTITRRSKVGWGWTCWTPEHPEPPARPDYIGTVHTVGEQIEDDRAYQSCKSGGTYLTTAWFAKTRKGWRRIVTDEYEWDFALESWGKATIKLAND